jgi:cytochrome c-type biogenesis protein CcmE
MDVEAPRTVAQPRKGNARRIRLLVGFLIIASAMLVLILRANRSSVVYYVTVTELMDHTKPVDRRGLRVTGKVVPGSIARQDVDLRFSMSDGRMTLPVHYRGMVPDTFKDDGEVVVEGKITDAGTFEASMLLSKCPSKYEAAPGTPEAKHPEGIPKTS